MTKTSQVEICLPKLGESIVTAKCVQWLKKEGEWVNEDEPIVEVATDKVNSEIPSPIKGKLTKILVEVDQEIEIGTPMALMESGDKAEGESEPEYQTQNIAGPSETSLGFLSPAVLRLVRQHGMKLGDLDNIKGTGQKGRITKKDIETYLYARGDFEHEEVGAERIAMSPMRKAIAGNLSKSFREVPHGYFVTEVDVADLVDGLAKVKQPFLDKHGFKLTITAYVAHAMARAAKEFPLMNASIEGDEIVVHKDINVGIAVNVDGGLMVPNIKKLQDMGIVEVAGAINDIAKRARGRGLKPDDVAGGSMTLTNFGMSGIQIGLPIIRHPEVTIISIGTIDKKVVVGDDDTFGIRKVVNCALSFDHRGVDGMYASAFFKAFKESLESAHVEV